MHSHPYFFMHARGKNFKSHIWKKAFFFSARLSIYKKPQRQRRRSATQQQNGDRQGKYEERAKSRGSVCRLCNRKKKNRQLNTVPLRTAMLTQKMDGKDCKGYSGKMNIKQPMKVELKSKPSRATF